MNWLLEKKLHISGLLVIAAVVVKLSLPTSETALIAVLASLIPVVTIESFPCFDNSRPGEGITTDPIEGITVLAVLWFCVLWFMAYAVYMARGL